MSDEIPATPAAAPVAAKPKLPKEQSLVLGILGAKERGKKQYGKAKEYLEALMALAKPGKVITLPDGRKFSIVDTFKEAAQVKKMCIIDRFEIQSVK